MPLHLVGSMFPGSSASSSAERAASELVSYGRARPALRILTGGAAQPARVPSRVVTQADRQQASGSLRSHGDLERVAPAARPTLTVLEGGLDAVNTQTKGPPSPGVRSALRVLLGGAAAAGPALPAWLCASKGSGWRSPPTR